MIAAMYFFLYEAVNRKSPSSIISFSILVVIFTMYMIFRDAVYINWPNYFFKKSLVETEELVSYDSTWSYVSAVDIMVTIFLTMLYFSLAKPTTEGLYKEALKTLNNQ